LLGEAGREGGWFATLEIGIPVQTVDMDLDMLTSDWWVLSTPSGTGSFFLEDNSQTYRNFISTPSTINTPSLTNIIEDSETPLAFPTCRHPTDIIQFPTIERAVPLSFAHCKPEKYWVRSLIPSGAYLGLAPGLSLSQTKTRSLLTQVHDKGLVEAPVFSLMVGNGQSGVFTIGGTSEGNEIKRNNHLAINKIGEKTLDWKWMKRHDTEGWWTLLMSKLWVNGAKILEKQIIILDVCQLSQSSYLAAHMTSNPDQHTIPHRPPSRSPSFIRQHFRITPSLPTIRPIPRLPLLQPTQDPLRLRGLESRGMER
jgi:hypothetical protein